MRIMSACIAVGCVLAVVPAGARAAVAEEENAQNVQIRVEVPPGDGPVHIRLGPNGARPVRVAPPETPPPAAPPEIPPVRQRARTIVLPQLDGRDRSVTEVLEEIAARSRELDPEEIGVNLVIRLNDAQGQQALSMHLRDVTVENALRLVAMAAGLRIRFEAQAAIVGPDPRVWR